MKKKMQRNGFTLVELAIALMVIGLLIGGVLKGQELIENARVTSLIRQIKAYDTATLIFRNTYGALPGDIKRPSRVPNCTTDDNSTCGIGGNGNGRVADMLSPDPNLIEEVHNFFVHLTKAGMIQGPEGGTVAQMGTAISMAVDENYDLFFPRTAMDTITDFRTLYALFQMGAAPADARRAQYYLMRNLVPSTADQIDTKIDDGKACKGTVLTEYNVGCAAETEEEITHSDVALGQGMRSIGIGVMTDF